jgi:hypothetical protein
VLAQGCGCVSRASLATKLSLVAALVAATAAMAFPSTGAAGCYWLNGSCAQGARAANSPTPWTGEYAATYGYVNATTAHVSMKIQIRPYAGASGYTFSSSPLVATPYYQTPPPLPSGKWGHRCFPTTNGWVASCGFQ